MESVKETIASFAEAFKERLRNPFLAAFLISWIFCNWRPLVYIMFANVSIEHRILHIDDLYSSLWDSVLFPLILATLYTFGMPYLLWFVEWCVQKALAGRMSIDTEKKLARVMNQQKIAREQVQLELMRSNYKEQHDLNKQIVQYKNEAETLKNELKKEQHLFSTTSREMDQTIKVLESHGSQQKNRLEELEKELEKLRAPSTRGFIKALYNSKDHKYGFMFMGENNHWFLTQSKNYSSFKEVVRAMRMLLHQAIDPKNYKPISHGKDHYYVITSEDGSLATSPKYTTAGERDRYMVDVQDQMKKALIVGLDGEIINAAASVTTL